MLRQVFWGAILYLVWNGLWMIMMGADKHRARTAKNRVSERTLFTGALCLGAFGVLMGMYFFRHKTKHLSFKVGIPILLMLNLGCLYYVVMNWLTG